MLPLFVVKVGAVDVAVVPWRRGGRLFATIVVKATFRWADGAVAPTTPVPLRLAEVHHRQNPTRSIREASDAVPLKAEAEILFAGSACTVGPAVGELRARIAVKSGAQLAVDKTVRVVGDRATPEGAPTPFVELPLVYERAFGGIGSAENPLGAAIPNVLYGSPSKGPAGFAPLSWTWQARKKLVGGDRKPLEQDVMEVADGIDAFFQAAPADQRARSHVWRGDEEIVLEGLSRRAATRTFTLPSARGVALLRTSAGVETVPLGCDTILVDGDAETVSLVWRGPAPMLDLATLAKTSFAGGVELPGRPVVFPELPGEAAPSTVRLESAATTVAQGGTLVMSDAPPETVAAAEPARIDAAPHFGTLVIDDAPDGAPVLPFAGAAPRVEHDLASPRSIPGAPWARSKAEPPRTPNTSATVELDLEGVDVPAELEPPSPLPVPEPAPEPAPARVVPTAWRKADPAPEAPPAEAPSHAAAARAQQPDVKKRIYGKFPK